MAEVPMLRRQERRALDEIEKRLSADDPDFVRDFDVACGRAPEADSQEAPPQERERPSRTSRPEPGTVLIASVGTIAVLCVFLGEGGSALLTGALAGVLYAFRKWEFRAL